MDRPRGRPDHRAEAGRGGRVLVTVTRLGPQACGTLSESGAREWLVTDGLGGYAIGTVAGLRTLSEWGVGSVSETAEGTAPHAATGCPAQAWSVAELLLVRRLLAGPRDTRRNAAPEGAVVRVSAAPAPNSSEHLETA
nr:glycogen debranching enzyme N-terminal domain-containing protein [Motilibacter deserti]